MGICPYCGKSAGLFHHEHEHCASEHRLGTSEIQNLISSALDRRVDAYSLPPQVNEIASRCFISEGDKRQLVVDAWRSALEHALDADLLGQEQEDRFDAVKKAFSISDDEIRRGGDEIFTRLVKATVIRDLVHGNIVSRMSVHSDFPINIQKTEKIIWVFGSCEYLEDKTTRVYVGRSHGFSVRIASGLYYRTGSFKGHPVDRTERVSFGTGITAVTDKHLYFSGPKKTFKVAYSKIVSFEPFSEGIGFVRDARNAKMQFLITGDGWFTYNVVQNLAKL